MNIEYLIEKYSRLVYKICYDMLSNSLDAEDAVQDVYINVYKTMDRYKTLSENELKNLICKIALNRCKDILKSSMKKLDYMMDHNEFNLENYESGNNVEELMIQDDEKKYINKMIKDLKEPYASVLKYYYLDELSLDEVSEKLDVSKGTLKMQIVRAKKMLKEKIIISKGGA